MLLLLLSRIGIKGIRKGNFLPTVSVVIAAGDEERAIGKRLENLLVQDYPRNLVEIIVVSDGSTDETERVVEGYLDQGVKSCRLELKRGKAAALNVGIGEAQGDIIVFADARQRFEESAVRHLVGNFADPAVGCVSGELVLLEDASSGIHAEVGLYWRYEKWIRKMESATGSVVGATGAIYAIRKSLYRRLPEGTILDDVLTPLNIVQQGYRAVFDGNALAFDVVSRDLGREWRRKVRTLAGNWQLMSLYPVLAFPLANRIWWRFMSHKVTRLLVPFFAPLVLVTGFTLEESGYRGCATAMTLGLFLAATGALLPCSRRFRIINTLYVFTAINVAAVVGFWKWATGQCGKTWQTVSAK